MFVDEKSKDSVIGVVQMFADFMIAENEKAKRLAATNIPQVQEVKSIVLKDFPEVENQSEYVFFDDYQRRWGQSKFQSCEAVDEKLSKVLARCDEALLEAKRQHSENETAIENNKAVREKVKEIFTHIGIPATYRESFYKTQRSRTKTTETKSAGYISDLNRNVPISDNFDTVELRIAGAKDRHTKYAEQCKVEINKQAYEEAKKELERKSVRELATMNVKYGDGEWEDVLDAVLSKDKYLALAHAMLQTRNDWSEGFYRVENAHDCFVVETGDDVKISDCISEILDGDESDGRAFRDCEWNYSVLFSMVDADILNDYNLICSKIDF